MSRCSSPLAPFRISKLKIKADWPMPSCCLLWFHLIDLSVRIAGGILVGYIEGCDGRHYRVGCPNRSPVVAIRARPWGCNTC